uniref:Uncharacterized protein n=1 Tax=viral metagenome TaxID=1070528 RepID=A0A6C0BMX1_9ZZZZ
MIISLLDHNHPVTYTLTEVILDDSMTMIYSTE